MTAERAPGSTQSFRAARIFVDSRELIQDGALVVVDGRISWVGPHAGAPLVGERIDLGNRTLLPGLIDAHVHVVWGDDVEPHHRVSEEGPILTSLRAAARLSMYLRAGVTTIRDLGSTAGVAVPLASAVEQGVIAGPHLLAAGRAITMTGGHGWMIGREADGADAVRSAVRSEIHSGATCIKVMASGGVYGSREEIGQTQLRVDELRAAVEEAHSAGLRVAAHAYSSQAIRNAVEAGVDTIEHGSFLDGQAADAMRENGVYLVNTLSVTREIAERGDRLGAADWFTRKAAIVAETGKHAFQLAREAGLLIAAGTDAGGAFQPHGCMPRELALMVEYGATAEETLAYATEGSARALGIESDRGTLRPGKVADFIVVDGDPTTDIRAIGDIRLVNIGGKTVYSN